MRIKLLCIAGPVALLAFATPAAAAQGCSTGANASTGLPAIGSNYIRQASAPMCDQQVSTYLSNQAQMGASSYYMMHQRPAPTLGDRLESCLSGLLRFPSINPLGAFSLDSLLGSLTNAACNLARQQVQTALSGVPGFGQNSFYPPGLSIPGVGTMQGPGVSFGTQQASAGDVNNLLNSSAFGSGQAGVNAGYGGGSSNLFADPSLQKNLLNSPPQQIPQPGEAATAPPQPVWSAGAGLAPPPSSTPAQGTPSDAAAPPPKPNPFR